MNETKNRRLQKRRSIRLRGYDYSRIGAYFVTICTQDRRCLFGNIEVGVMKLNEIGNMISWHWNRIPFHCPNVELDVFVVMPNHIHGIIQIVGQDVMPGTVGVKHSEHDTNSVQEICGRNASPLPSQPDKHDMPAGTKPHSLSAIIQNFKSVTSRKYNRMRHTTGKLWQRNFYERIIRDEAALNRIREYIRYNPMNWEKDTNNPFKAK